jgi:hypothetical protein
LNEQIIYLLRKTSLTLSDIEKLTPKKFNAILKEVYFQESQDQWRQQYSVACLMASIANTIPRKKGAKGYKAEDFLKEEYPSREIKDKSVTLESLAKAKGIKLPKS